MYDYSKLIFCPRCGGKLSKELTNENKVRKVCNNCRYILYRNPLSGTSAIIEEDGKILLVKRDEYPHINWWSLPGGFIEYDESPEKAVKRETFEETGYKIKIKKLIGVYFYTKNVPVNAIGPTYSAKIIGGRPKKNIKWFSPNRLPRKFAYPDQLMAIVDWQKIIKNE